jgi:hypothetical protein
MQEKNFEYNIQMPSTNKDEMAKRSLLSMAKDLYNLYVCLNNGDDLPEWCHYKLATSRKDVADITDYLTSKVMKHCLDSNISPEALRLEIKKSMTDSLLEEGLFDFFSSKQNKTNPHKDNLYKTHNPSISYKKGYVNNTIWFSNIANEISKQVNLLHSDPDYADDPRSRTNVHTQNKKKLTRYNLILLLNIVYECTRILSEIEEYSTTMAKDAVKMPKPEVTSARRVPKKKSWFNMFKENYHFDSKFNTLAEKRIELIDSLMNNLTSYFKNDFDSRQDIKNFLLYGKKDVSSIQKKLTNSKNIILKFLHKHHPERINYEPQRHKDL